MRKIDLLEALRDVPLDAEIVVTGSNLDESWYTTQFYVEERLLFSVDGNSWLVPLNRYEKAKAKTVYILNGDDRA